MATTKITQKDYFNAIIALAEDANRPDIVEFAKSRIELLEKKSENRKPTKAQEEGAEIAAAIKEVLTDAEAPLTVTNILATGAEALKGVTNQRVSALLRKMVLAGEVTKTIEKKKSYFSI